MNKAEKHIMHTKTYNEVIKHRLDAVQGRCAMPGRNLAELHKETNKAVQEKKMHHFDKVLTTTVMPAPETPETESSLEINFLIGNMKKCLWHFAAVRTTLIELVNDVPGAGKAPG